MIMMMKLKFNHSKHCWSAHIYKIKWSIFNTISAHIYKIKWSIFNTISADIYKIKWSIFNTISATSVI